MASVCHHGIPLFHVSLWTPGEQQFYAFTLLSMLLEHLPNSWKVGCLYDIGCQIHHAIHKWDFASEWRKHLSWVYQFSMHMDISGPVNCGIIHVRMLYGVCQMEKGVKGSGASYATLFLDYVLWVTTIVYLCLTCKSSISLQRNTSNYQGGSRNIFNVQRVGSTLQLKSLAHDL